MVAITYNIQIQLNSLDMNTVNIMYQLKYAICSLSLAPPPSPDLPDVKFWEFKFYKIIRGGG